MRRVLAPLIALAIMSAPLPVEAQQAGTPARVGVLCLIPCQGLAVDAFRLALRDLGYIEGRTLVFEYRDAEWKVERLPALAGQLVQSRVDVIFTPWGTAAALAAKRATATIPVVIGAAGDPVRAGIVASLPKPGGNVTGLSSLALELEGKRLEFAKEVFPKASRVGIFWHSENPYSALAFREVDAAARALGVRLHAVKLSGPSDLETAFATLKRRGDRRPGVASCYRGRKSGRAREVRAPGCADLRVRGRAVLRRGPRRHAALAAEAVRFGQY